MFSKLKVGVSVSALIFGIANISANETLHSFDSSNQNVESIQKNLAAERDRELIEPCPIEIIDVDDDCDPGGGGGSGGPYTAPSTPSDIEYASYARGSVKVSWGASNGYNYPVRYHLQERKNNGSWVEIYSGYGQSRIISNRSDGNYTYRVKGSNSKGSSGFRSGYSMTMKSLPTINFSAMYPGLEASRAEDTPYMAASKKFNDVSRTTGTTSELEHNLGKGFGLTEGTFAPEAVCLKSANLSVRTTPISQDSWDYQEVETTQDLYRKLDLDISADLSLSIGAFGLNADGKYKLFRESKMKRDYSRVVVRWERRAERLDLESSAPLAIKNYWKNEYIDPYDGSTTSETHFRKQCGDKYVSAVETGARLYVLLEIENEDASLTEMETISYNAKIKIGEIFNASSSGSVSNETREFFTSNSISLKVYTEGGSSVQTQTQTISIDNIRAFVDNFVASVTPSGYVSLTKELQHYPIPVEYNSLSYFSVFRDYRPEKQELTRWISLDHQVNARCYVLEDVDAQISANKYRYRCHNARADLGRHTEECSDGNQWADCSNPNSTNLPNDFYNDIPSLYAANSPAYNTSSIDLHVSSCWTCRSKSKTVTALACLPQNECLVDKSKQYTDSNPIAGNTAPNGAQVYVNSVQKPSSASGTQVIRPEPSGEQCLSSSIYMKTKGRFSSSTAYYHGSQSVHGRCPVSDPFPLP